MRVERPWWRNYLLAYLLVGLGATVFDVSAGPTGSVFGRTAGAIGFLAGFAIFTAAIGSSVRFVLGPKPKPICVCPRCSYDLTGNVSGICPECGTPIARP